MTQIHARVCRVGRYRGGAGAGPQLRCQTLTGGNFCGCAGVTAFMCSAETHDLNA